jgi:ubiquinone/menaquinone biosynthesis C-methylase UbiE
VRYGSNKLFGPGARRTEKRNKEKELSTQNLAFRVSLETLLNYNSMGKSPCEIFYGISDQFWYWLNTEGMRHHAGLCKVLPGVADENTQEMYTGKKGDSTLWEGFYYYTLFKKYYEKYCGYISTAKILDFGCGWGRIIRYFIKDISPENLWGCDPVPEMIQLCKEQNKCANFELINSNPPTSFDNNTFDLVYSFSVFSHLSEDFHFKLLGEIKRILKPGGIYMTTTRNRAFISECREFDNKNKSLSEYDAGLYCHHNFAHEKWPYWGESSIPKQYVQENWTEEFTVLDYIEDNFQNLIIIQKPI